MHISALAFLTHSSVPQLIIHAVCKTEIQFHSVTYDNRKTEKNTEMK